ncbi:hypothetical protein KCP71_16250 [Salmonella enterica subsp. enterica]|nr:hypothetical protein KCP71_16250 [Salmonella enterica subsp. enterica]
MFWPSAILLAIAVFTRPGVLLRLFDTEPQGGGSRLRHFSAHGGGVWRTVKVEEATQILHITTADADYLFAEKFSAISIFIVSTKDKLIAPVKIPAFTCTNSQ